MANISVKLSGKPGTNNGNGTVLYYHNNEWLLVCDDEFDDVTAEMVCRDLGYVTGYAICCSAYGKALEDMMKNQTLHCTGEETTIGQCLQNKTCNSTHYASAVCFSTYDAVKDGTYPFVLSPVLLSLGSLIRTLHSIDYRFGFKQRYHFQNLVVI